MKLFPTRNLLARAAAHRAMAKAALFSDSSAAVRLKRYNSHIEKARDLEAKQDEIRKRRVMRAYDLLRAEKAKEYPAHVVTFARTGETQTIHAPDWRDAMRQAGRADACQVEHGHVVQGRGPLFTAWRCDREGLVTGVSGPSLESVLTAVVCDLEAAVRGKERVQ